MWWETKISVAKSNIHWFYIVSNNKRSNEPSIKVTKSSVKSISSMSSNVILYQRSTGFQEVHWTEKKKKLRGKSTGGWVGTKKQCPQLALWLFLQSRPFTQENLHQVNSSQDNHLAHICCPNSWHAEKEKKNTTRTAEFASRRFFSPDVLGGMEIKKMSRHFSPCQALCTSYLLVSFLKTTDYMPMNHTYTHPASEVTLTFRKPGNSVHVQKKLSGKHPCIHLDIPT